MQDSIVTEIKEAIKLANCAINHLQEAKKNINSALRWGVVGLCGGGFGAAFMRDEKMEEAESEIDQARRSVRDFCEQLKALDDILPEDEEDSFSFFCEFLNNFTSDLLAITKIAKARKMCDEAISKVEKMRDKLKSQL